MNVKDVVREIETALPAIIRGDYQQSDITNMFRNILETRGICACKFPEEPKEAPEIPPETFSK